MIWRLHVILGLGCMRWLGRRLKCDLSQLVAFLKGVLKPDDKITTDEMLTSSEEVEETDERRIAFQYHREHRRYAYAPKFNE